MLILGVSCQSKGAAGRRWGVGERNQDDAQRAQFSRVSPIEVIRDGIASECLIASKGPEIRREAPRIIMYVICNAA